MEENKYSNENNCAQPQNYPSEEYYRGQEPGKEMAGGTANNASGYSGASQQNASHNYYSGGGGPQQTYRGNNGYPGGPGYNNYGPQYAGQQQNANWYHPNAGPYYEKAPKKPKKKKDVKNTVLTICLVLIIIFNVGSIALDLTGYKGTIQLATSDATYQFTESLTDVSDVVAAVMPAVVSITSRTLINTGGFGWGFYIGEDQGTTEEVESGIGSGTIVGANDSELLILTSYHVVEGCSSLYVTFVDDASVEGTVKNADEDTDIAIVAVAIDDIETATLESIAVATLSTAEVETGEGVIVIGNALGYGQSVVTGIISATSREITLDDNTTITVLQTDAAINSGNSGGCVLNAVGEVIGISEAKIQDTAVEGMCYAIPIAENYDLIISLMGASDT